MKTVFLRLLNESDKQSALLAAVRGSGEAVSRKRFDVDPSIFSRLPRSPFAYWLGPSIRHVFERPEWQLTLNREARNGLGTLGDFRFVRLAVEVPASIEGWVPFSKGGHRSPYYQDVSLCVNWKRDGAEIKAHIEHTYGGGHWSRNARSVDYYFRAGLTWPLRGIRFSAQAVPSGGIFSVGGKMLFSEPANLLLLLSFLNSRPFDMLVGAYAGKVGGVQYESGLIEAIPIPITDQQDRARLETLCHRAWSLMRRSDTRVETSHAFTLPALLQVGGSTLRERCDAWASHAKLIDSEFERIQSEIDERCFRIYGISEQDRLAAEAATSTDNVGDYNSNSRSEQLETSTADEFEQGPVEAALVLELMQWAVGVAFGRFDIRVAIPTPAVPAEVGPFDRLPLHSPGMLTIEDSPPLTQPPGYEVDVPLDGILVDAGGHPRDIDAAVSRVLELVFQTHGDSFWNEASSLLGSKEQTLRKWLSKSFFGFHLKRYSRSSRQAPMYLPLSTASNSFTVWLYYPRLSSDTVFTIVNRYVQPKVSDLERELWHSRDAHSSASGREASRLLARIEELTMFLSELTDFRDELLRVAQLPYQPNLADGVIINAAPLHKLFRQPKWAKDTREVWQKLERGDYDWAHMAYSIWPDRVREKCRTDRSLALAHDLEHLYSGPPPGAGKRRSRAASIAIDEDDE